MHNCIKKYTYIHKCDLNFEQAEHDHDDDNGGEANDNDAIVHHHNIIPHPPRVIT